MKKITFPIPPSPIEIALTNQIIKTIPKNLQINLFPFYSCYDSYVLNSLGYNAKSVGSNYVVSEFWKCFKHDKSRVLNIAKTLHNTLNQFTFPLNQKNWVHYDDPFVRSAFFFLLANLSTTGLASTGALKKKKDINFDFSHIKEASYNNAHVNDFKLERIFQNNCCAAINAGVFSLDIFSHSEGSAVDQTILRSEAVLSECKNSFDPWIIAFKANQAILEHAGNSNVYFYDAFGQTTGKDNSEVYLLSNV